MKKQRVSLAEQEDFNYFLDGGHFYQDYAFGVDEIDHAREENEVVCLEFPFTGKSSVDSYMRDPSAFVASQARKGRMEVSLRKSTAKERDALKEAMKTEVTSVLYTEAVRVVARKVHRPCEASPVQVRSHLEEE